MSRNVFIAIAAAIVGALIVVFYNILVPPLVPPTKPLQACSKPKCDVSITVYNNDCSISTNILAAPDRAPIARGNQNPNIEWTIATDGFTFPANGIDFGGDSQFTNGNRQGPTKFRWMDKNSDDQYHKYTVNLLRPDGTACPPLDPGVINGQ